ncbi:MAG TPA: HD domain-containing phosphohydrolase [Solirubrobacter sp.]|nr:HD domain-containing phosphohydrolase [Solirubrobacter sp.]
MAHRRSNPERWLLAAAVVALGGVVARALGAFPGALDNCYHAAQLLAIAVCALHAVRERGRERAAWVLLTLGLAAYTAGDLYYSIALLGDASPPDPSPSDAGYLLIYPAAYAGLVLLLRARAPRLGSALWLDGLVCALACAAVGAALVFNVVARTDGSFATVAINLAYPLADLALVAFVVAVAVVTGRRGGPTWWLLGSAFALYAVADGVYLYQAARGTYGGFTLLDACWPAAFVLVAFAASRPATRLDARRLRGTMLAVPAAFTLVALALLVLDHYRTLNGAAMWLATAAVAAAVLRFALTFRENLRTLGASEREALTDELTGLGNRRALFADLPRLAGTATPERPAFVALFDLDGFKAYNDSFGHPAGDALLRRLGRDFAAAVGAAGHAYRVGGDEFCLLTAADDHDALLERASAALSSSGERFSIRSSRGAAVVSPEDPYDALRLADQRMYVDKRGGRRSTDETVHQVLLRVATEHDGELRDHVDGVAVLVDHVARELGLAEDARLEACRAAALHDIGKVAIPDAILHAPRALTPEEWRAMRQHTVIGERIIAAAPELAAVARIVRSSHERFDGAGYPDGLAGTDIPLGARIVAVCDAYDAMISDRAYRPGRAAREALDELERCAGTQFDPDVVAAFAAALAQPEVGVLSLSPSA